jgi:hypothetical protein
MKKKVILLIILVPFLLFGCNTSNKMVKVKLENSASIERIDEPVSIPVSNLLEKVGDFSTQSIQVFDGEKELPYQIVSDMTGDSQLFLVLNFKPKEVKEIVINYGDVESKTFPNRTYAELVKKKGDVFSEKRYRGTEWEKVTRYKVPATHIDHDGLFKYEGPGWESELVGYRFYLDWRNSTDIFGKKIQKLVLSDIGKYDTTAHDDSYHNMQEWGMDVFKVGSSLGIGTIGMTGKDGINKVSKTDSVICEIKSEGPLRSEIQTEYYGWAVDDKKYDLIANLTINAGSRLSKYEMKIKNADNLSTGLAKFPGTSFVKSSDSGDWQYISLWGKQSLADDELGIALFYNKKNLIEHNEDKVSHIVKLQPQKDFAEYYFCAAWVQEPNSMKTEKEFLSFLDNTLVKLNNPIIVE